MPKRYTAKQIIKVLKIKGFFLVSQRGSHKKFRNKEGVVTIVPEHKKEVTPGTFSQILKQTGILRSEFEDLV